MLNKFAESVAKNGIINKWGVPSIRNSNNNQQELTLKRESINVTRRKFEEFSVLKLPMMFNLIM